MSKSTIFIHVDGMRAAWSAAYDLARDVLHGLGVDLVHFAYDADASRAAGYSIYRAAPDSDGLPVMLHYNYICDLGDALELNTCRGDWSGDVYRIRYTDSASTAGSSAAAGAAPAAPAATPAGSSQSAAAAADSVQSSEAGAAAAVDPDLVTLRLPRADVQRILLAILAVNSKNITEALSLGVGDPRRGACIRYAREWDALRRGVRLQLADYDVRRGCGVDPLEVV